MACLSIDWQVGETKRAKMGVFSTKSGRGFKKFRARFAHYIIWNLPFRIPVWLLKISRALCALYHNGFQNSCIPHWTAQRYNVIPAWTKCLYAPQYTLTVTLSEVWCGLSVQSTEFQHSAWSRRYNGALKLASSAHREEFPFRCNHMKSCSLWAWYTGLTFNLCGIRSLPNWNHSVWIVSCPLPGFGGSNTPLRV